MKALTIVLVVLFMMTGCTQGKTIEAPLDPAENIQQEMQEKGDYTKITPEEAKNLMGQEGVIILDVRTQEEYEGGHIEGALLLPVDQLEEEALLALPDKGSVILVYCKSGNRSKMASETLIGMGYTNVLDFGGISNWPYETVK